MNTPKNKHKGWQRVLLIIIPYIIIVGIFQYVGALLSSIDVTNIEFVKSTEQHVIMSFFSCLGTVLVVWIFVRFIEKDKFLNVGFHIQKRLNDFIFGLVLGALIMVFGYLILVYINEITYVKSMLNFKEIVLSIILFTLVSITEELLLRGYVLRNFMISFNKYVALVLSSILFALMHGFNPNIDVFGMTNIFLAGLLLGITYIYTKNLWFPIALHLSWNLFQTFLGFNVSGQDAYSVIEFSSTKHTILNGGSFGFEGSILASIAMIISILGILFYYERKSKRTIFEA